MKKGITCHVVNRINETKCGNLSGYYSVLTRVYVCVCACYMCVVCVCVCVCLDMQGHHYSVMKHTI